jgi:oligoribonuclease (3'-5' exoribonuclease)
VTGGPFQVRALPPVIWVDGVAVGVAQENERLTELTVITFDLAVLREGGTIAVSYGMDSEDRSELVEKLSVGSAR